MTHLITISSGKTFQAQENESLLDAALRQHVVLDYSCRTGRCSSCKGRIVSGETVAALDETGLTAAEREAGYVLTCVRQARSDTVLEIDDLGDIVLPDPKTLPCRIHQLNRLSDDVMQVMLRLPPTSALQFLPGQYIELIGPEGVRRAYSLANAPRPDGMLELHIREVPDGAMSRYWFQNAKANDLLRLRGPLGTFFLRDQADKDVVFLATGTGIAPVKAILEQLGGLDAASRPRSVTVYWGGRQAGDLYWTPPVEGVRFVPVLSRADAGSGHRRGYVQDVFMQDQPALDRTLVYACGSDTMIHSAQALLTQAGLNQRHFHSDAFVSSGTV